MTEFDTGGDLSIFNTEVNIQYRKIIIPPCFYLDIKDLILLISEKSS